ncbi:MAG TPA: DNA repair protein RecO [Tepidisphaeraceae bacterium]|jgi:DNA repair protein RecO (recombination protein O)|nr:DNA repair protein RecO [Tepidisphaeraceae bacterium]
MPLVSDRCICLRKVEFSETSQILHLYTRRHGLLRVIAKGAHRRTKAGASKFDGGVDLLDIGDAVFTHDLVRDLQTLTEWHLADGHPQLRSNLRGLHLAMFTGELCANLFEEHDPHPPLFDRFQSALSDFGTPKQEETFLALLLDLLRESGYLPELSNCVECGAGGVDRGPAFMSASRGGLICRNCEAATPDRASLDVRLLRLAQSILKLPRTNGTALRLPRLTRHQTDPLNHILIDHVEHQLGRRFRMPRYVLGPTVPSAIVGR